MSTYSILTPSDTRSRARLRSRLGGTCCLAVCLILAGCQSTVTAAPGALAAASANTAREDSRAIVVAAHPLAVQAGTEVLQRGGSAMDAAFAVQLTLGLVEPQSSGIGGGAFILSYDASSGHVQAYMGRERAPAAASSAMFEHEDGTPLTRGEAMLSGRATGVPGLMAVFDLALREQGRLPWNTLFESTIQLADKGFMVTPRLSRHIAGDFPQAKATDVQAMFAGADGHPLQTGQTFRNPAYAQTLRTLANDGAPAFYRGPLAKAMVERVGQTPLPGSLTLEDMAGYHAVKAQPLCRPLKHYRVCVPPPPSSGVGLLQLLAMLEHTGIASLGPDAPQSWYLFAEASRLMYADRDHYVGDPDFVDVPVEGLLDPDYIRSRAALIATQAAAAPTHGMPPGAQAIDADRTTEPGGTTHFVVVDAQGNAVSVTSTIESFFGSGRAVGGFFLNNQLTDFSWSAGADRAANAIAAHKRPRSSMSPSLLLDADGRLAGAMGSPGGNSILAYVGKAMVGAVYWDMALSEAFALPNIVAHGTRFNGEAAQMDVNMREALRARGMDIRPGSGEDSGLHGVIWREDTWDWAADPRREGSAGHPSP